MNESRNFKSFVFPARALLPILRSMPPLNSLHEKALSLASIYKRTEAELLVILGEIDKSRAYLHLKYRSLFEYCVQGLKLPEGTSYNLITVSRKSVEVPELQTAVCRGDLTVSKAKKIASVITSKNKDHWLSLAQELPRLALEKEVAKFSPKEAAPEKARYISGNLILLSLGISEEVMNKIRRVQDLESKRRRTTVSLECVLEVVANEYLERNDPVKKAEKRVEARATYEEKKSSNKISALWENERKESLLAHQKTELKSGKLTDQQLPVKQSEKQSEKQSDKQLEKQPTRMQPTDKLLADKQPTGTQTRDKQPRDKQPKSMRPTVEQPTVDKPLSMQSEGEKSPDMQIQLFPGTVAQEISFRRNPIKASLRHQIYLRDRGQCQHQENNKTCGNSRFTEIHHLVPVSRGGKNNVENLKILCSSHHRILHLDDR